VRLGRRGSRWDWDAGQVGAELREDGRSWAAGQGEAGQEKARVMLSSSGHLRSL
jgi:hypothetical protein